MKKYTCLNCNSNFYSASTLSDFLKCPTCGSVGHKALLPRRVEITNSSNGVILVVPEVVFDVLSAKGILFWDATGGSWAYRDEHELDIVAAIRETRAEKAPA